MACCCLERGWDCIASFVISLQILPARDFLSVFPLLSAPLVIPLAFPFLGCPFMALLPAAPLAIPALFTNCMLGALLENPPLCASFMLSKRPVSFVPVSFVEVPAWLGFVLEPPASPGRYAASPLKVI